LLVRGGEGEERRQLVPPPFQVAVSLEKKRNQGGGRKGCLSLPRELGEREVDIFFLFWAGGAGETNWALVFLAGEQGESNFRLLSPAPGEEKREISATRHVRMMGGGGGRKGPALRHPYLRESDPGFSSERGGKRGRKERRSPYYQFERHSE